MSAQLCHDFLPSQQMAMARWKSVMDFQMLLLWLLGIWMVDVKGQGLTIAEDDACLSGFKTSVQNSENLLSSWSSSQGVPPCNGSISSWTGVTCDNNRVFSLMLPNLGLSGVISSSLSRCSAMNTLDLSANHMSGGIPPELGELSNLVSLNLSMNQLSGPIPTQISNCSYLNALDLHGNELDGPIPSELGSLVRLQVFDVSDNGLTGPIPSVLSYSVTGAPRFNASSFDGNKDLFGFPLPASNGHNLSVLEIVGIGFASGIFSLIVSFTAVCVWVKVSEQRRAAEEGRISELITDP